MKKLPILPFVSAVALLASPLFFSSCAGPSSAPPAPAVSAAPEQSRSAATAGLRAGDYATSRNNIDSFLNSRPGLGTGWGSTVSSQIGYTSFQRSSSKPKSVATIYYNDKEGINAMASGFKLSGNGMQTAANGLVEWGVKSGWSSLKNYHANGRRYVVGKKGANYSLVVKNLCHSALEVVLSVDGLDVMDGRPASLKKRGYIIQPGKTLTVKGFRTSESAVASFKFSSVSSSYSNLRHGKTRNVGVIGMAVFTQKGVDPWKWSRRAVSNRHSASPFAEAPAWRAR